MNIQAREKYLQFEGYAEDAIALINSLHEAYFDSDMPKVLNDFVFNIDLINSTIQINYFKILYIYNFRFKNFYDSKTSFKFIFI